MSGKTDLNQLVNDPARQYMGRVLSSIPASYTVFYDNIDSKYRAEANRRNGEDFENSALDWGALINSILGGTTGVIHIHTKAGTYNSSTAAALNRANIMLTGDGWATKIQASQVDPTWNLITATEDNLILRDFRLDGRVATDGNYHVIYASGVESGIIDGLYIQNARNTGLLLSNCDLITILQCRSMGNYYAGYQVGGQSWGIRLFECYSETNLYWGFILNNVEDVQLIGCQSYVDTRSAIGVYSSAGIASSKIILGENIIRNCASGGAGVPNAERSAIRVYDDGTIGSTDINIYGNLIYDKRVTPLMLYGILTSNSSDYVYINNNRIRDAQTAQLSLVGANNQVSNNVPFKIEHHTTDDTLTVVESGTLHTNLAAGANIKLTLPQDAFKGCEFEFAVMTAGQQLQIDAGAAGAIYINGAKQADDAYIWADDEGESIKLVADGNGDWIALYTQGTWTVV